MGMRETSEAPLIGVFDRQDNFLGIKKRGQVLDYQVLTQAAYVARDAQDVKDMAASVAGAAYAGDGLVIELDPKRTYSFTAADQFEANIRNMTLKGNGASIICDSNIPVIKATTRAPDNGNGQAHRAKKWTGLRFQGPGRAVAGSAPIMINAPQLPLGVRLQIDDVVFDGFDRCLDGRDGAYLLRVTNFKAYKSNVFFHQRAATDAGENCSFDGGVVDDVNLAFLMEDGSSEVYVGDMSFDYLKQLVVATGSPSRFYADKIHWEPRGKELGADPLNYVLDGTGTDTRAVVPGKDSWIDWAGNGSLMVINKLWWDVNNSGGAGPYTWDNLIQVRDRMSKVIINEWAAQNLANVQNRIWKGPGRVLTNWLHTQDAPSMPTRMTTQSVGSLVTDGVFANGLLRDMWCISRDGAAITNRFTGANGSIARSTDFPDGATQGSLKITKTAGAAAPFQVTLFSRVRPGQRVSSLFRARREGMTGNIFADLRWYRSTGSDGNGVPTFGQPATSAPFDLGASRSSFFSDAQLAATASAWFDVALPMVKAGATGEECCPEWADMVGLTLNMDAPGAGLLYVTAVDKQPW